MMYPWKDMISGDAKSKLRVSLKCFHNIQLMQIRYIGHNSSEPFSILFSFDIFLKTNKVIKHQAEKTAALANTA